MATKKDKIQSLFNATFTDSRQWNDWYFDNVYKDSEAFVLENEGNLLSSLMMAGYDFKFHDSILGLAYMNGVATARGSRGKGYMHTLIAEALRASYATGDTFAAVIPASDNLYFFYDKFGFATVVYFDLQRYTSVHVFRDTEGFVPAEPTADGLRTLLATRPATVLHSPQDFRNIVDDNTIDGGTVVAARDEMDGSIAAMAFAVPGESEITVREIIAVTPAAERCVLAQIADHIRPLSVHAMPQESGLALHPRAMLRIVNAQNALEAIARKYPKTDMVIRLHDPIIVENNGVYILHGGLCRRSDYTIRHLDLDVGIDVMTSLIFGSPRIGDIFGIPAVRPSLPLMLD